MALNYSGPSWYAAPSTALIDQRESIDGSRRTCQEGSCDMSRKENEVTRSGQIACLLGAVAPKAPRAEKSSTAAAKADVTFRFHLPRASSAHLPAADFNFFAQDYSLSLSLNQPESRQTISPAAVTKLTTAFDVETNAHSTRMDATMDHSHCHLEQGVPLTSDAVPQPNGIPPSTDNAKAQLEVWANKYRGATVADLDLAPALSTSPSTSLEEAMLSASSHDYSHLTVLSENTRSLVGYLSVSKLKTLFESRQLQPSDPVEKAMVGFQRRGRNTYKVITMETELWELEGFFENLGEYATGSKQDFAVVTDGGRKFVLGVVTRDDLVEFVKRRPSLGGFQPIP